MTTRGNFREVEIDGAPPLSEASQSCGRAVVEAIVVPPPATSRLVTIPVRMQAER